MITATSGTDYCALWKVDMMSSRSLFLGKKTCKEVVHLDKDSGSLRGREWDVVHEVRDVPVERSISVSCTLERQTAKSKVDSYFSMGSGCGPETVSLWMNIRNLRKDSKKGQRDSKQMHLLEFTDRLGIIFFSTVVSKPSWIFCFSLRSSSGYSS